MSMVRFAMICDHCGERSPEYTPWWNCEDCGEDVCDDCIVPGSQDEETRKAVCLMCEDRDDDSFDLWLGGM